MREAGDTLRESAGLTESRLRFFHFPHKRRCAGIKVIAILFEIAQSTILKEAPLDTEREIRPRRTTYNSGMEITLTELEQAINYWRALRPSSGEERSLSPEVNALATDYALMIFYGLKVIPADRLSPASVSLLQSWRQKA